MAFELNGVEHNGTIVPKKLTVLKVPASAGKSSQNPLRNLRCCRTGLCLFF